MLWQQIINDFRFLRKYLSRAGIKDTRTGYHGNCARRVPPGVFSFALLAVCLGWLWPSEIIFKGWDSRQHTVWCLIPGKSGRDGVRRRDLLSGSVFFVLAILLFFQAYKLTVWEEQGPAEGFFPMGLSLVFAGLSLLILIQALLKPAEAGERVRIIDPNRKKFFAYVGLFFGFGILFPIVGYTLTLAMFLVIILRWAEKQSWKIALLVTILLIGGSNLLFVRILNISIPEGVLSSAFQLWP
jgi:hypothetical protein